MIDLRSRFLDLLKVCCFLSLSQALSLCLDEAYLLQEECVADQRKPTNRLAMSPDKVSACNCALFLQYLRVREGNALIVSEVRSIILPLPSGLCTRNLGDDICWSLIGTLHVTHSRVSTFSLSLSANGIANSLKRVLARVELVGVERHGR